MTTKILFPGSEFGVKQTSNEFLFNLQSVTNEVTDRTLVFSGGTFGIVDTQDPALVTSTDSTRAFHIGINVEDQLSLDINAGIVFSPSGHLITLATKQTRVPLSAITIGAVNLVFMEYRLVDSADFRLTRFNAQLPVRHEKPTDTSAVQVVTLDKFTDLSIFNLDRLQEIVVLGIVTVVEGTSTEKELDVDLSRTTFTNNRPWFSLTDNTHRSQKGTGSDSVPHSLGLNDLSAGSLTLYQQFLEHGIIINKDLVKANIPGSTLCSEVIPNQAWRVDTTGEITKGSQYASTKAFYVELSTFPTALVSVYVTGDQNNAIAGEVVPKTNIFVLAPAEDVLSFDNITVEFLETKAALAATVPINNEISYSNPKTGELIISGGLAFTTLLQNSLSFKDSGGIPQRFKVFLDRDKNFVISPQILMVQTRLSILSTNEFKLTTSQYTTGRVTIGLTKALEVSSAPLSIKIEVKGQDAQGATLLETLSFDQTWEDVTIPGKFNPKQFASSVNIFSSVDSIKVTNRQNDGSASEIMVYSILEPFQTNSKFNELSPISLIEWDGTQVSRIKDLRVIRPTLDLTNKSKQLGVESETINPVFNAEYSITEDFRRPSFQDSKFSVLDRYTEGLAVDVLPDSDTTLITTNKYRSRPIGIRSFSVPIQEIAVVLHRPSTSQAVDKNSVHARFSGIGELSTGTLTVVPASVLIDGETFTLNDGIRVVSFEFDNNNIVASGNVPIDISVITLVEDIRDAVIGAVNNSVLDIDASIKNNTQINLVNRRRSAQGNTTSLDTVANVGFVVTDMQNGVSEAWEPWEILVQNSDQKFLFSKDFIKNIGKFQIEIFGEVLGATIFFKDRTKAFLSSFGGGGGAVGTSFFFDKRVTADGFSTQYLLPNGQTYAVGNNSLMVFVNGIKKLLTDDFTELEDLNGFGTKVDFVNPPVLNSKINYRLKSLLPDVTYDQKVTADGILSLFTLPLGKSYVLGRNTLEVYVNGAKKFLGDDYTEIDNGTGDGTQVQFLVVPANGSKINFRIEN